MALAWLTKSLASAENMKVYAFIVDHGARPESAREAEKVADIMEKYQFKAQVLRLSWPGGLPASAFETLARTARYRALAKACVSHDIRHVLLGHHSDDLAETVMMRITRSSRAEGLRGMRRTARIPESAGIYGAEHVEVGRPFLSVSKVPFPMRSRRIGADEQRKDSSKTHLPRRAGPVVRGPHESGPFLHKTQRNKDAPLFQKRQLAPAARTPKTGIAGAGSTGSRSRSQNIETGGADTVGAGLQI